MVSVVMTFTDSDNRRWLAGAWLGPLCAEEDASVRLSVLDMLDRALVLASFKVVRPDDGQAPAHLTSESAP